MQPQARTTGRSGCSNNARSWADRRELPFGVEQRARVLPGGFGPAGSGHRGLRGLEGSGLSLHSERERTTGLLLSQPCAEREEYKQAPAPAREAAPAKICLVPLQAPALRAEPLKGAFKAPAAGGSRLRPLPLGFP